MIQEEHSVLASSPIKGWEYTLSFIVLFVVALIAYRSAAQQSITIDEIDHIPAGISYFQQHDGRMNPEHPPLMKMLAALPLVAAGARLDYANVEWANFHDAPFGEAALSEWGQPGAHWIVWARIPMIAVTLALGWTVFFMARQLTGTVGGFLSLMVFAGTPFFYAYGPLVHTDIGIALFGLLAIWTFASVWSRPNLKNIVRFGLCLSGALLTKFTAGLLLPCFAILGVWFILRKLPAAPSAWQSVRGVVAGIALASLIVYSFYFLLFWKTPTPEILASRFQHSRAPIPMMLKTSELLAAHPVLDRLSSPAIIYTLGVGHMLHALPRSSYFLGKIYSHGTVLYFPTLYLLKMPIGFVFLSALLMVLPLSVLSSGIVRVRGPAPERLPHRRALTVLLAVFTAAALWSPLNLGIRHISVPIASLTVLIAMTVPYAMRLPVGTWRSLALVLIWLAVIANLASTAAAFPDYISYFNSFLGSRAKYAIAIDSNLDWGQSLIDVRRFEEEHHGDRLAFDVKGSVPRLYLTSAIPFDCENGAPAGVDWAVISANRMVVQPNYSTANSDQPSHCSRFFQYPYAMRSGGALYIFHLSQTGEQPSLTLAPGKQTK
jgi:4-amino-4-deoxy-L-arabinose transferase-like glycosyltransferase